MAMARKCWRERHGEAVAIPWTRQLGSQIFPLVPALAYGPPLKAALRPRTDRADGSPGSLEDVVEFFE